jgi:Bacterial Ig domain
MTLASLKTVLLACALLLVFAACDKVTGEDKVEPNAEKATPSPMYVLAGTSAIMNTTSLVNNTAQISVVKDAQHGTISFEDDIFVRYVPQHSLKEGRDSFTVKINEKETTITIIIMSLSAQTIPCEAGVMLDSATTTVNSPVSVDVLKNDQFCKGPDLSTFHILLQPKNGHIKVDKGSLTFTPDKDYVGVNKVIYTVVGNDSTQKNGTAEVYFNIIH